MYLDIEIEINFIVIQKNYHSLYNPIGIVIYNSKNGEQKKSDSFRCQIKMIGVISLEWIGEYGHLSK